MLSADGIPVLIHDETLDRTTDGSGRVADQPWSALARLDAGGRFHGAYAGEAVPRLADALALCARLGLAVNLEIKPAAGQDEVTARAVAALLQTAGFAGPLLLSSFSPAALAVVRAALPGVPRALLVESLADWSAKLRAVAASALHCPAAALIDGTATEVVRAGVPVAAFTVNEADLAEACWAAGAAALFTDRLDRLGP